MKNFSNKTAAITGAGSGIGRALARQLAKEGCHLSLADVNEVGLTETVELIKAAGFRGKVTFAKVDVANRAAVETWAKKSIKEHGQISLLFNNAGIAQAGTVESNSIEDYEKVLNVNLWGVIYGTKAFLPHMREQNEGHIVNISSVFGLQSQPGVSAYNASKFAVRGFTESLRQELDMIKGNVSASCVHPGGINTNIVADSVISDSVGEMMGASSESARKRFSALLLTTPERAATVIITGVRRNARRILIGADARLLDWEARFLPTGYQRLNGFLLKTASAF